ncbi:unnamed protein product, partial [Allacma fusca]
MFISCDGVETSLTYKIYSDPFQDNTWVSIFAFAILTGIFLEFHVKQSLVQIYPMLMLPLRALLEQVDVDESEVPRTRKLKMVMTMWLLASVVLSNAYKGILTSDLTALKPANGFQAFDNLTDFDLIISPYKNFYERNIHAN